MDLQEMRKIFAAGIESYSGGKLSASFFAYGGREYMILHAARDEYSEHAHMHVVFRVYKDGSVKWLQRHPVGAGWVQASKNPHTVMNLSDEMGRIG